jgi:hypothetical protein
MSPNLVGSGSTEDKDLESKVQDEHVALVQGGIADRNLRHTHSALAL